MSDGAHLGISVSEALGVIVGGDEQPEGRSDADFEAMVRQAPLEFEHGGEAGYEGAANATARLVLEAYETYPQLRDLSDEHIFLEPIDWSNPIALNVTLYEVIKKLYPEHYDTVFSDLTGFMWGWAVNAARKILGLGPMPNPALLTVGLAPDEAGGATIEELTS